LVGAPDEERRVAEGVAGTALGVPEASAEHSVGEIPLEADVAFEEAPNGTPLVLIVIAQGQPGIEAADALVRLLHTDRAVVEQPVRLVPHGTVTILALLPLANIAAALDGRTTETLRRHVHKLLG
ncbi:MAG: hypothetical protein NUV56_00015, partial [Candidatus Uhrbacteria bacterium]|nr:hypothetical protein [Candidatus Uhrbacteria bacterium]